MRNNRNINPSWTVSSSIRVAPRCSPASDCGQSVTNFGFNLETTKEKEMKISQTYPAALTATHTNDSAPQKPKSARRGLMQRLGFAFLACALAIGATGTASAGSARDEGAVRGLGDAFANAFVQKNAELRASLFAEDGTFVTPQGDFLQGRVAMVKDFGPEAEQAVNGTTQAAFSNYRVRFIKPDVAVVDALLTVHNVNGPDGTIIPVIPINFFYVAVRHADRWLIEDGRAYFAPAPPNGMTSRN
jgi:uncharacterized protein (TIGR02246 family)